MNPEEKYRAYESYLDIVREAVNDSELKGHEVMDKLFDHLDDASVELTREFANALVVVIAEIHYEKRLLKLGIERHKKAKA